MHFAKDVPLDQVLPLQLLDLVRIADDLVDLGRLLALLLPFPVLLDSSPQLLLVLNLGLDQHRGQLLPCEKNIIQITGIVKTFLTGSASI